jgi:hypothetical protein
MAHFRYQALNAEQHAVAGELHAETVSQAIAQLESHGLTIQSIGYVLPDSGWNSPAHVAGLAPPPEPRGDESNDDTAEMAALGPMRRKFLLAKSAMH